jgi:hypothetical protein
VAGGQVEVHVERPRMCLHADAEMAYFHSLFCVF